MADDALTGLRTDARKGISFDPDAARTMATHCGSMLSVVNTALNVVGNTKDLKPLNQRDSGAELAKKFNAAASKLVDTVLVHHRDVLTNMGATFVAAGGLYQGADEASARTFTDAQATTAFNDGFVPNQGQPGLAVPASSPHGGGTVRLPGWGQSSWSGTSNGYDWSGTAKEDYNNKLSTTDEVSALNGLAGKNGIQPDPVQVTPEPGAQYEWDDFHNHWVYVNDSKVLDQLANFAQDWLTAQAYLKNEAETFKKATDKYLKEYQGSTEIADKVWASPAAKIAKDAILAYLGNLDTLTASMELVSANYAFAQGWLKKVQNFMPYNSISNTTTTISSGYSVTTTSLSPADVREAMQAMRQAWDNWYGEGVKDSSKNIPLMPDPNASIEVKPPQVTIPPVDTGNGNGNGSPKVQTPNLNTDPANPTTPTDPANPDKTTTPTNPDKTTTTDQTQQTLQTLITQASTVLQAGITAAESAVEKVATAIQSGLQTTTKTLTDTTTTDKAQDLLNQELQQLGLIPNGDSPSGKPSGGIPTGGSPGSPGSPQTPKTQLFPRAATPASTTEETTTTTARAGLATTSTAGTGTGSSSPMGGSPMSAASQGQGKEYKRAQYLNAGEHLDEALGEVPAAVKPVAEK